MKNDFTPFDVGTVWNPIHVKKCRFKYRHVELMYPSRLNAMALDPSKIANNDNLRYSPGEIIFKIKLYKKVLVEIDEITEEIQIEKSSARQSLIRHSAMIMKKAIGFKNGLKISVETQKDLRHVGLGSSSGLIASVACAINELYGNPISKKVLLKYLAQNHGEEINNNPGKLSPVQCIGGSAAAGLYSGSLLILAGQSNVIFNSSLPAILKVVMATPIDFNPIDAYALLQKEIDSFPNFIACGEKYGREIAYRLVHEAIPGIKEKNLKPLGDLIFDYRFKMGSIENCSYCYPLLPKIARAICPIRNYADILSLSSVGPSFFAITKNPKECKEIFNKAGLKTFITEIDNKTYSILQKY